MTKILRQVDAKEENPSMAGWYDTDKGNLFWYESDTVWSCRDDRVSEEYPKWWYDKKLGSAKQVELLESELKSVLNKYEGEQISKVIIDIRKDVNSVLNKYLEKDTEASVIACQLLRVHFIPESHPNLAAYNDDYIIKNYPDEWSWFMQGWVENDKFKKI